MNRKQLIEYLREQAAEILEEKKTSTGAFHRGLCAGYAGAFELCAQWVAEPEEKEVGTMIHDRATYQLVADNIALLLPRDDRTDARGLLRTLAVKFAQDFKVDNPLFDLAGFLAACGIHPGAAGFIAEQEEKED